MDLSDSIRRETNMEWQDLPDAEKMSLPFFERNCLTETTHCATATWIAAEVHSADLISGRLYVVHMVIADVAPAFNFLWPMLCAKRQDGTIGWHFPVTPEDQAASHPNASEAHCSDVVGIVLDISRDEEPVDLPVFPGVRFS
jgi:hypothetical protein